MELLSDSSKIFNFPPHKKGDTVENINFDVLINNDIPPYSITLVKVELRREDKIWKRYTSNDDSITLYPPNNFVIESHILDIPAGEYDYDIEITYSDGSVKTYIKGVWKIFGDITR